MSMRKHTIATAAAALTFWLVCAGATNLWDGTYATYKGSYLLYSNDLDEKQPPTAADRRISFMVEGTLAKNLFDSIGPDLKVACGSSSSVRVRQKGDVDCTNDKDNKSSPYTCHFGFNLRTGKSILSSTC